MADIDIDYTFRRYRRVMDLHSAKTATVPEVTESYEALITALTREYGDRLRNAVSMPRRRAMILDGSFLDPEYGITLRRVAGELRDPITSAHLRELADLIDPWGAES